MKFDEFKKMIKSINEQSDIQLLYESTKKSFNNNFNSESLEKIEYLNSEILKYQEIEKLNKKNMDRLDRFASDIVKKYCDKEFKLDKSKLDYSSLENFDKSIVKQLNDNDISMKVNNIVDNSTFKEKMKLYF